MDVFIEAPPLLPVDAAATPEAPAGTAPPESPR
jgi:hypothetical protein